MTSPDTPLRLVIDALNRIGIPFMAGGSLASSIHGVVRATQDIDLVVKLRPPQVDQLVAELGPAFYADAGMIRSALAAGRSFNLIHYATGYKFDLFPLKADAYYELQFHRRVVEHPVVFDEEFELPVATAEDTILAKLAWYRAGGEVSERQWNDVRGVIHVQRNRLDLNYMRRWAKHLEVEDLLDRVLRQCGGELSAE